MTTVTSHKAERFSAFVQSFFLENKQYLCGYHRRRTELSQHNFIVLFFLSSYRRNHRKKFNVYLPSFPQCNHLVPRIFQTGGPTLLGAVSVFHVVGVSIAYLLLILKNLMSMSKMDDKEKVVVLPLEEQPDRRTLTIQPDILAQKSLTPDSVVAI